MISYLTKIGENEFRIDFNSEIFYRESKSVIVDGETYTKEWTRTEIIDSKTDFENAGEIVDYWHTSDIYKDKSKGDKWVRKVIRDFEHINGQIYYVWDYTGFLYPPCESLRCMRTNSSVGHVRILFSLVENNHVKNILRIWTMKTDQSIKKENDSIIEDRAITMCLFGYGFNNGVYICVNFYHLLHIDFTKIVESRLYYYMKEIINYYPKLFNKKILFGKLTDIDRNENAINFLNQSINLKQSKK